MCYACERRETVVVNISLRATRSPFLRLAASEEPEDLWLFSDTMRIHVDLLRGSSRSLLARLVLFIKPSITHI